jgi:hypothetical protein
MGPSGSRRARARLRECSSRPLERLALTTLAALVLAACAPHARAPGAAARARPSLRITDRDLSAAPRTVDGRSALADLDVALQAFGEAYAGVGGRPPVPPSARVAATRAALGARAEWPPADLARTLLELFAQPDGHLAFGFGGATPLRLAARRATRAILSTAVIDRVDRTGAWIQGRRLLGCVTDADEGELLPSPDGRLRVGLFGGVSSDAPLACLTSAAGPGRVASLALPLAPTPSPAPPRARRAVELIDGTVPVLAVRTFASSAEPSLRLLPELAASLRHRAAFVVDLRGNAGGNYALAEPLALELASGALRRLDEREVVSIEAAEGRANAARRRLAEGVPEGALPLFHAQIAALEAQAGRLRAGGAERTEVVTAGVTIDGHASRALEGRGVVLVDAGCASACEMFVGLARQIPGLVVAGTNTHGSMAAGELALFRLPRSGVTITLGTRGFRDASGAFAEARGYLPDVWLDGPDLLAEAQRLAADRSAGDARAMRGRPLPRLERMATTIERRPMPR